MHAFSARWAVAISTIVVASLCGCDQQDGAAKSGVPGASRTPLPGTQPPSTETARAETERSASATAPRGERNAPVDASAGKIEPTTGAALALTGITWTVPKQWVRETFEPGRLGAKAAFRLAKAEGDSDDATVRITHFPNMKRIPRMVEMNISRWLGQVTRPDGSPYTRDMTTPSVLELGDVRVTVVDLIGNVRQGMGAQGTTLANHRMIAAIVDHPQGPHFVKAVGGKDTMKKWEASIDAFLKSAKPN